MANTPNLELLLWFVAGVATVTVLAATMLGRGVIVRYVTAMVFAAVGALVATLFISTPVASYITSRMTFESPDGVEFVHALAWIGVNAASLVVGWLAGWFLSWPLARGRKPV